MTDIAVVVFFNSVLPLFFVQMYLPEGFLSADVIVTLLTNIADGMHVWPGVVRARVMSELPFMATENILMECVKVRVRAHAGCARVFPHHACGLKGVLQGRLLYGNSKCSIWWS